MNYVTPSGFRDVLSDEALLREQVSQDVLRLFASRGYAPVETPTLEVLDVMQAAGHVPATPFRFFDSQGDLLAMRPDVTLQIARMCATRLAHVEGPLRFRYMQRVFREAEDLSRAGSREMTQIGVECIGPQGAEADSEVITLLAEALGLAGVREFKIALGTVTVLNSLLDSCGGTPAWVASVREAYHASNFVALDELTRSAAEGAGVNAAYAEAIAKLPLIRGGRRAIEEVRALVAPLGCDAGLDSLVEAFDALAKSDLADKIHVDFSVVSSFDYYTGIVFEAYAARLGTPLGSGGRYDNTIGAFGPSRPAAGFAFYLEQAMAAAVQDTSTYTLPDSGEKPVGGDLGFNLPEDATYPDRPLRIAVPKGSLNPDTVACLEAAGLDVTGLAKPGRQLIIRNPGVEYIIVRPTDAPVFVELGAADCGICGADSLIEADADVVELVDLKFGACRFIVAEPAGAAEANAEHYRRSGSLRIATKYPRITASHFAKRGVQVEITKLHGNIELAPLTGMAECIVDITATGTTLRENNLVITDEVLSSTARFFSNSCVFRTDARITALADALQRGVDEGAWEASVIAGGQGK